VEHKREGTVLTLSVNLTAKITRSISPHALMTNTFIVTVDVCTVLAVCPFFLSSETINNNVESNIRGIWF